MILTVANREEGLMQPCGLQPRNDGATSVPLLNHFPTKFLTFENARNDCRKITNAAPHSGIGNVKGVKAVPTDADKSNFAEFFDASSARRTLDDGDICFENANGAHSSSDRNLT